MSRVFDRFGLVFSGGGARGAYEVGVAKYLAEHNYEPSAYSGASIGALNAVLLGTAPTFREGVARLEQIWRSIQQEEIVKVDPGAFALVMLHALGARVLYSHPQLAILSSLYQLAKDNITFLGNVSDVSNKIQNNPMYASLQKGLLDDGFLRKLLNDELELDKMTYRVPIWISAYRSRGTTNDILAYLLSSSGIKDNPESDYFEFAKIPSEERLQVILASAAIPVVYGSHIVKGKRYVDGGVGGQRTARGNTPLAPLVQSGFKQCIVVNLSDGSMFNRHEFPDTNVIEIRPEKSLHPKGIASSLLDFREERIEELMALGYEDAKRCISNSVAAMELVGESRRSEDMREEAIKVLDRDGFDDVIGRL